LHHPESKTKKNKGGKRPLPTPTSSSSSLNLIKEKQDEKTAEAMMGKLSVSVPFEETKG